jgi:hypothetical protein
MKSRKKRRKRRLPLQSEIILGDINSAGFLEISNKMMKDGIIEILSAEECIPVRRLDLENSILNLQDGNI